MSSWNLNFFYRLCTNHISEFEPHLNLQHLAESLKTATEIYKEKDAESLNDVLSDNKNGNLDFIIIIITVIDNNKY